MKAPLPTVSLYWIATPSYIGDPAAQRALAKTHLRNADLLWSFCIAVELV